MDEINVPTLLQLIRVAANPQGTQGVLLGDDISLVTLEGRIPADRISYVSWLLPPKKYLVHVEKATITYKGMPVPGYWCFFERVFNFPKCGFVTRKSDFHKYGIIKMAQVALDDYRIDGFEEATRLFVRWCKKIWDERKEEPFYIEIIQNEDELKISDMDYQEYKESLREQEEAEKRKNLLDELFN